LDWQAIDRQLPWHQLSLLAKRIKPRVATGADDPFARFGPIVDDEQCYSLRRQVDIRDVYGICASKSHIVPLAILSQTRCGDILACRDVQK
jgi:hypothetical protein